MSIFFNNPKLKSLACIERWNFRLQGYDFEEQHAKGNENPSDYLSRHTSLINNTKQDNMAEEYICEPSDIMCCSNDTV